MSVEIETAALVALLRSSRRWEGIAELVERRGSAVEILDEEWGANRSRPRLFEENGRDAGELIDSAAADIARWREQGMQLLTVLDRDYPKNLRSVQDRPPLLFVAGQLEPSDARSVAVIGSRSASERGVARARSAARHLVARGFTVLSGLAAGIDTEAHTSALAHGGRTVAVIGTSLGHCYPAQNASLQRTIADKCAVVSQFWPNAPPRRGNFPMRNAVMSGLALATVIIEATHRSGARTQARLALAHGRPVLLLATLLAQPWARELAARPGAHAVRSAEEISEVVERLTSSDALVA